MADPSNYYGFCGVGLETTAGTPVRSQHELDLLSETLQGKGEPIRSSAINRTRAVKKAVQGPYRADGDLNVEVTPDKFTKLLYAMFDLTTTGSAAPFTHVFKSGDVLRPLTVQVRRDDVYFVYPGQYVSRLVLRGVIDQILQATVSLAGRAKERLYNAEQSDAGITQSVLSPFAFIEATTTLHGAASTDTNNWEVNVDTGLITPKGLGAGRAPNRAHPGDSLVSGSFDVVFDTVEEHRRWMGAATSTYPINVADILQTFAIQLKYAKAGPPIEEFTIDITKAYYAASGPALTGREGVIMQPCQFKSLWDNTDTDIKITIKSDETNTIITTLGTNIP